MNIKIKPGIYRHFKGGEYKFIGVGKHSETQEDFVVYQSLADKEFWIRPLNNFTEEIEKDGYKAPRFVWVREN